MVAQRQKTQIKASLKQISLKYNLLFRQIKQTTYGLKNI